MLRLPSGDATRRSALRILHLVSYPVYSGPLPPTLGLALAQRRLGHTVYLAHDTQPNRFPVFHEEPAAPRVTQAGLAPPRSLTLSFKSTPLAYWRDWRALRAMLPELNVVHVHLSHDHVLAALAGNLGGRVKRVRTIHADRSLRPRLGQRWLAGRADGWIVRCVAHQRRLLSAFPLVEEHVQVIPGGIDADEFAPATAEQRARARARFAIKDDAPVLVHAALLAQRGQRELVEAVGLLGADAPRVLLAGAGPEEQALRDQVQRAGLAARVSLVGYLQGEALRAAYAAADAAFVAQPGNDASARAALEAMACGLPVLAVQVDALAELVDAEVGYPIARREPADIAAALRRWLTRRQHDGGHGAAGRRRVQEQRSFAGEAARTLDFYRALAG